MNTPHAVLISTALVVAALIVTRPQARVDAQSQVGRYMISASPTIIYRADTLTGTIEACGELAQPGQAATCRVLVR